MGNRYLNSGGGNSSPYESTTNAATTLTGLLAGVAVAAGEIIWAKNDSITVESSSATVTLTSEGSTPENPLKVLSVSDWNSSPGTLAVGALITSTGSYAINIVGHWLFSGVTFSPTYSGTPTSATVTNVCQGTSGPHYQVFESCSFIGLNQAGSHPIVLGTSGNTVKSAVGIFNDCSVKWGNTAPKISHNNGFYVFKNLSILAGSSTPANLFGTSSSSSVKIFVEDSDLSNFATGALVAVGNGFTGSFIFRNCKLHASTVVVSGTWFAPGGEILIINSDSGDTYTKHSRYGYEGIWSVATSIYATTTPADMSSGSGDTFSIQMASSANVSKYLPLYSQWFQVWNDAAAYTPTIEVLVGADGASALYTDQLWIEVDYNSGTNSPLGTRVATKPALLATGSAVAAGTTAWTGDGYTTERTHKLSTAQITPDKPGWIYMRVALAKASTTIYVNPPR